MAVTADLNDTHFRKAYFNDNTVYCFKIDLTEVMPPDIYNIPALHLCFAEGLGLFNLGNHTLLDHLPVNPGAQMHVLFSPSLSQVPPFRQLMLAQGSLYSSQCVPAEKQTRECDSWSTLWFLMPSKGRCFTSM